MEAAALVREARRRSGLTQQELAARCSTSQSAVARIERGVVTPSITTLRRLLRAAGFELRLALEPIITRDPVVEAYKRDVDRTLLRENLRKSVDRRLRDMEAARRAAQRLRRDVRRSTSR